jgi:hypothetical protein
LFSLPGAIRDAILFARASWARRHFDRQTT